MKMKLLLAAVAVTFSFAMISCGGNKAANSDASADSLSVEVTEEVLSAPCCQSDSATCDTTKVCDKKCCDKKCCDKKCCDKKCCDKKSACEKKCCDKKSACEKKSCDKK